MLPLLREGDAVLVAYGRDQIQRGNVVLFRQKGKLVAHRVWKITQDDGGPILVTKGDSLFTFDAPLPKERIVGRVVAVERNGRQFRLDSPGWQAAGWLIAVATLCVAVPVRGGQALLRRMRTGRGSRREK
jgi:signal peptidase I